MKRRHALFGRGAATLGWHGVAGICLLALMGALYLWTVRPAQTQLDALRRAAADQRRQAMNATVEKPQTPADRINAYYGFFPLPDTLPDQLDRIFGAAAAQALAIEHGDYRVVKDTLGGPTKFQITFPVKGTYPQIRKFISSAQADVPALALSGVQFERKKVGNPTVDAKIKFVVFMRGAV